MADPNKGRIEELTGKMRSGKITASETDELKGLLKTGVANAGANLTAPSVDLKPKEEIKKDLQKQAADMLSAGQPQGVDRGKYKKVDEAVKPELKKMAAGDFSSWEDNKPQDVQTTSGEQQMVQPVATVAPTPVPTAPVVQPAPTQDVQTTSGEQQMAIQPEDAAAVQAIAKSGNKKSFGETLKALAVKYGVPMLEILQAVGYQRAGINKPTILEQKYQTALDKETADYAEKLAQAKEARTAAQQEKLLVAQQEYDAKQKELDRLADKEAQGIQLSAQEKLAKMQLMASKAAQKTTTPAGIIPE